MDTWRNWVGSKVRGRDGYGGGSGERKCKQVYLNNNKKPKRAISEMVQTS